MICYPFTDSYIDEIISKEPPAYYPSQNVAGTEVHPVVSQPIPLPTSLEMKNITLKLTDFGHGRWRFRYLFILAHADNKFGSTMARPQVDR